MMDKDQQSRSHRENTETNYLGEDETSESESEIQEDNSSTYSDSCNQVHSSDSQTDSDLDISL